MASRFSIPVALALVILPCSLLLAVPPRDALDGESRMEFIETPLAQIVAFLSEQHAVKIVLAPRVEGREAISVNATGRLADLLTQILRPLNLEYRIDQDAILIAPTDEAVYMKRLRGKAESERLARELQDHARETLKTLDASLVEDGRGWIWQAKLSGTNISDNQIAPLRGLRRLARLDLSGTAITDEGLSQLKGLEQLAVLRLGGTRISDEGLKHLRALPGLQSLDISKTEITDDGLLTLAQIPTLRAILVADTRVTATGITKLREKFPQIRVQTELPKFARPEAGGANQVNPADPFGGRRR